MKRIIFLILFLFICRGSKADDPELWNQVVLSNMTMDWNQTYISFSYNYPSHYLFPNDYTKAENTLNEFFCVTHGFQDARVYVEKHVEHQVYVEIDLGPDFQRWYPSDRVFNIECHLFKFVLTQKGLVMRDANISQSGSLIEGNAKVIFPTQFGVSYELLHNDVVIQDFKFSYSESLKQVPVTQDGVYTVNRYVFDMDALRIAQSPVKMSGNASFSDDLTPLGGTISGAEKYYRGITNNIAVVSTSEASNPVSQGNCTYTWEMKSNSGWETIPNEAGVNCVVNTSGAVQDIYVRRKVVKAGRTALSNVHMIKCIKGTPAYANPNSVIKTVYTSEIPDSEKRQSISYLDGFGRSMQTVEVGATPNHADLVNYQEYDSFGRESESWLPVPVEGNNGAFVPINAYMSVAANTYTGEFAPYSKPVYEASPLNRVQEQYGPGYLWYNNASCVKTSYLTNTVGNDTLNCIRYTVSDPDNQSVTITKVGNYTSNELYVTRMEDEDGSVQFQFKDTQGNLVLVRQLEQTGSNRRFIDTYYIYDVFNNQRVVLPPHASEALASGSSWNSASTTSLNDYAYLYKYDERSRPIAKKLPGCAWTYYVYDNADRLIFSQTGEQRQKGEWMFTIPDVFGRACLSGICKNSLAPFATQPPLAGNVNAKRDPLATVNKGYSITGITLVSPKLLSVNYYDNYAFLGKSTLPEFNKPNFAFAQGDESGPYYNETPITLLTGTLTACLDDEAATPSWLCSVMYYDDQERLIETHSTNHLTGGMEKEYMSYNFVGAPVKRTHIHSATGKTTQTEVYGYEYDHAGRLLTTTHKLNNASTVALVSNQYDELGRLKTNNRNGQVKLRTDYTYNIRSWTKSIAGPLFSQTLYYNEKRSGGSNTPCFNGNISAMDWYVVNDKSRGYDFAYDPLSRLTAAHYLENGIRNANYNTSYSYDKHGNMLTLNRRGNMNATVFGDIDRLTMSYNGNQLTKVIDVATDPTLSTALSMDFRSGTNAAVQYYYDTNGNLTKDLNKGISDIQYNSLNLPTKLLISGTQGAATNTYLYSADGRKLNVTVKWGTSSSKNTDYVGNVIYENGVLKRILVDGGYIEGGIYHFYLTDHLGNNRVVAKADGTVVQSNHYYPFGMSFADGITTSSQPYKFGNKELDTDRGLNWYDFSARYKTVDLPPFTTMDPLAEKYYSISPYAYCANNPIKYIDLRGDSISMTMVQAYDTMNSTDFAQTITADLQSQTGLALSTSTSTGQMTYAKDANGNPVVATTTDASGNIVQVGSATARDALIKAISNPDFVNVAINASSNVSGVPRGSNDIWLSPNQINGFITGATNLDNRTLGWGMTLIHELHHTQVGGGLLDTPGNPGPVVTQMNIIRSELNAQGGNYGQRLDYGATSSGGYNYIPFNIPAQGQLGFGFAPLPINKFIRFK